LIVQCRLSNKRLPNKLLKKLNGKPSISYFLDRIKLIKAEKAFALADEEKVHKLESILLKNNYDLIYKGSVNNVLKRFYETAKKFKIKNIIRVTSDCIFFDPYLVNKGIDLFFKKKLDYLSNNLINTYPKGLDYEIFTFKALEYAAINAKKKYDKEHVTPYLKRSSKIKKFNISNNKKYSSNISWTLDTKKDLYTFKKLFLNKKFLIAEKLYKWKLLDKYMKK